MLTFIGCWDHCISTEVKPAADLLLVVIFTQLMTPLGWIKNCSFYTGNLPRPRELCCQWTNADAGTDGSNWTSDFKLRSHFFLVRVVFQNALYKFHSIPSQSSSATPLNPFPSQKDLRDWRAIIIKCAPDYRPGVWTVIMMMISSWSFLFQSERLFGFADDATSNNQQNREGKTGITIWIGLDADVSILVTSFFFVQPPSLLFTSYMTWKPNIRGRGIRSLNSINRGSANRKGGVARKGKIFITFVSPSSAFRYTFTRRHLWGKTLLLYLSSAFEYIFLTWRGLNPVEWDLPHRHLELITVHPTYCEDFRYSITTEEILRSMSMMA